MAPPYRYLAQVTAIVDRLVIDGSAHRMTALGKAPTLICDRKIPIYGKYQQGLHT